MLDHALLDAIGVLRQALEAALLERHAFEERFQVDVLLGDLSWETSYTLPGEGVSPRVQAEITFDWPTWSQSAFRSISIGEPLEEPPEIDIEVILRLQRLASRPDTDRILAVLSDQGPSLPGEPLERSAPVVEEQLGLGGEPTRFAVEVSYAGVYQLEPSAIEAGGASEPLRALGGWIASNLVRLADLDLVFLPPDLEEEDHR